MSVETTEENYQDMFDCVPPIWVNIQFEKPVKGFAVSEPYDFQNGTVVCSCFWKQDGKFYTQKCEVRTPDNKPFTDSYHHQYGRGYIALPNYVETQYPAIHPILHQ